MSAPESARREQSGVTLIELVVVLILLGVLAAMIVPRFLGTGVYLEYSVRDQLISAVRFAQQRAMSDNRANACYRLLIEAGQFGPQQSVDGGSSFAYIGPHAIDAVTSEQDLPAELAINPAAIYFGKLGNALDSCGGTVSARTIDIVGELTVSACISEVGYAAPC